MTILIIDSSEQIISRLESLVMEVNDQFTTKKAKSFDSALLALEDCRPNIVLLDMSLPSKKSYELLTLLKEKKNKNCIIALSSQASVNMEQKCKKLGADYFLDKYLEFEKIPGIVTKKEKEHTTSF